MTTSRARVAYAELRALSGPMMSPAGNARARWTHRDGLLLLLRDEEGRLGLGEASPLPGYSRDDLASCSAALQQVPWGELSLDLADGADLAFLDARTERVLDELPPAARCAAETALLALLALRRGVSLAALLRGGPPQDPVAVSALLSGSTPDEVLASAEAARARGFAVLKLKIGQPGSAASELATMRALRRQLGPAVALRLDANRAWPLAEARERLAALAELEPELIEEPLADARELVHLRTPLRIALDESLQDLDFAREVTPLLASRVVAALILKPMALGGPRRCLQLARRAAEYGAPAVVTHLFDGPVALAGAAAVALALPRALACGLDSHPGLALGPPAAIEFLDAAWLRPPRLFGLGIELTVEQIAKATRPLSRLRERLGEGDLPASGPSPWPSPAGGRGETGSVGGSGLSLCCAAAEVPAAPALIIDGQVYTFGELAERVRRLMGWLGAQPLLQEPWPRVALCADNRIETVLLLYALMELGVTAVLVHPRLTASERAWLLSDCQPALWLDERFTEPTAPLPLTPPPPLRTDGPLAILYTSGTTGRPKGVMLSRRAFVAAAAASARNLGWQDDDRWLLCMPLAHVGGLSILVRCLLARRPAVLMRGAFDTQAVAAALCRDRVSLLSVVPTMLGRLLALSPPWSPPPHLRAVLLGGAAASEDLLERAAARGVPVLTTYGLTEACSQVTTQRYGTPPSAAQGAGEPLACLRLRIRPQDEQIQLQSPTLFDGYWPPGAHPSPIDAEGWFSTGDLGRLDAQGRLHVLARRTDLIVSGGENVYPVEVEQALERCAGVAAACVLGVPDAEWGQLVAAALVPTAEPIPLAELRQQLHERLAAYKHPRRLVWLPALPLNPTGKLDRAAVARLALGALAGNPDAPPRR